MWNAQSHQIWQKSRPVAFNFASDKRIAEMNNLTRVIKEAVEAARESLVIGQT
jgi:hypothetical protein